MCEEVYGENVAKDPDIAEVTEVTDGINALNNKNVQHNIRDVKLPVINLNGWTLRKMKSYIRVLSYILNMIVFV